jgi:hypothetical protein
MPLLPSAHTLPLPLDTHSFLSVFFSLAFLSKDEPERTRRKEEERAVGTLNLEMVWLN